MKIKSVINEAEQIQLAIEMINLGARLQLLESQTELSRERLIKLYKEIKGYSPPKGMLPFSTDWFLTWQPNIHSSIFLNIYNFLVQHAGVQGIQAIMKAYKIYLNHMSTTTESSYKAKIVNYGDTSPNQVSSALEEEPVLSLTRAWTLIRFVESKMLKLERCTCCSGHFVVNSYDIHKNYVCNLCHIPSRAGKTKKAKELAMLQAEVEMVS